MDRGGFFETLKFLPYLLVKDGKVVEVSCSWLDMMDYSSEDVLHKTLSEVFRNLVKNKFDVCDLEDNEPGKFYFLFTKSNQLRQVNISVHQGPSKHESIYVFTEKPNSRLEDKFPFVQQLYLDNVIGVAIYSAPDFRLLKANGQYLDFMYEPYNKIENVIGLTIKEFIPGWIGSPAEKIWANVLTTGKTSYIEELKCDKSNRKEIYWDLTLTPIVEEGNVKYIIVLRNNVTDKVLHRKHIEDQAKIIAQQKEQLETIMENISDAVLVLDKSRKFIKLNKTARAFFNSDDFISTMDNAYKFARYFDMEGKEIPFGDMPASQVARGEEVKQRRILMQRPDRSIYVEVSGRPIYDNDGNFNLAVLCINDVTENIKYKELIEAQRDYLYKIIDTLDLPIMRVSYPELNIIEINQKAHPVICGIIGCDVEKCNLIKTGESILNILPQVYIDESLQCISEMEQTKEIVYCKEFEIIRYGKKAYYNLIYQPILNSQGEIAEILVIGMDITYEAEKKIELEKILKMKDEFFSFISHEFRTPLTVINSAIQAMEAICKNELSEKAKGFIKKIRQNSLRQLRLVNNLLDITRAESGYIKIHKRNMDIVHMTKAITESVTQYARGKGVRLKFSSPLTGIVIAIDDEKYERILLNLLSNAIKFTPPGKTISVKVFNKKGRIYIEVKDEGVGIPIEKQEVIFDCFGQVSSSLTHKSEGTGIGLYLVKVLVNELGGDIWLSSEEGSGSTFTTSFPITKVGDSEVETLKELTDNRLIQSAAIEFSDIYDK